MKNCSSEQFSWFLLTIDCFFLYCILCAHTSNGNKKRFDSFLGHLFYLQSRGIFLLFAPLFDKCFSMYSLTLPFPFICILNIFYDGKINTYIHTYIQTETGRQTDRQTKCLVHPIQVTGSTYYGIVFETMYISKICT